jgi:hypothetical protein
MITSLTMGDPSAEVEEEEVPWVDDKTIDKYKKDKISAAVSITERVDHGTLFINTYIVRIVLLKVTTLLLVIRILERPKSFL